MAQVNVLKYKKLFLESLLTRQIYSDSLTLLIFQLSGTLGMSRPRRWETLMTRATRR